MRTILLAGTALLAVTATASAAPIFSEATPGAYTVTLTPGTYDILAYGAQGGNGFGGGDAGAEAGGDFTFTADEVLTVAVGGQGTSFAGGVGGGGGGGGGGADEGGSGGQAGLSGGSGGFGGAGGSGGSGGMSGGSFNAEGVAAS